MKPRNRLSIGLSAALLLGSLLGCGGDSSNPTDPGNGGGRELNSGNLAQHQSYSHTFSTAGTYPYHCEVHGTSMSGSVIVQAGAAANVAVGINANTYAPNPATVGVGGTVTWTNHDPAPHTVTSDAAP